MTRLILLKNTRSIRWSILAAALLCIAATAGQATAQIQAQAATRRGNNYVGLPIPIRVVVTGVEEEPRPECRCESTPAGVRLQLAGVSPNISHSVQIYNGHRTEETIVQYVYNYYAVADQPGTYTIGPFTVEQNGQTAQAGPVTLTVENIEQDENMRIEVIVPPKAVYPGQPVPVRIEWWYAGDFDDIRGLEIYSPLFDQFRFVDEPITRRDQALPIETSEGTVNLKAEVSTRTDDGRQYVVISAERTMIPEQSGHFELPAPTATVQKVIQWERDFFGDRVPAQAVPVRAIGQPIVVDVKSLPTAGRPASFAGAIGPGYSIDVEADRTVVRVGDPIRLTVTVHGKGNIKNAGLPPLSADGGLDPHLFRLPDRDVPGVLIAGGTAKQFETTVRVLKPTVKQIPAVAYSWFNPETEKYETTRSKPIALSVEASQIVSASDVVGHEADPVPASSTDNDTAAARAADAMVVSSADLSAETDPSRLLRDVRRSWIGLPLQSTCYLAGGALLLLALLERRRQNIPPEVLRRRGVIQHETARIRAARHLPRRQAAEQVAAVLRSLMAELPQADRRGATAVVAECETVIYAPESSGAGRLDPQLLDRALAAAEVLAKEASSR